MGASTVWKEDFGLQRAQRRHQLPRRGDIFDFIAARDSRSRDQRNWLIPDSRDANVAFGYYDLRSS
jgi:hypothetical protein